MQAIDRPWSKVTGAPRACCSAISSTQRLASRRWLNISTCPMERRFGPRGKPGTENLSAVVHALKAENAGVPSATKLGTGRLWFDGEAPLPTIGSNQGCAAPFAERDYISTFRGPGSSPPRSVPTIAINSTMHAHR